MGDVLTEEYTVGGMITADYYGEVDEDAVVYRPDNYDGERFPLIAFSHGFGLGGDGVYAQNNLLADIASAGYVIVAHKSGGESGFGLMSPDQVRTIEWAKDSDIYDLVDWEAPVGLMGYSLGGAATLDAASNADYISAHNIRAAAAMHPGTSGSLGEIGINPGNPIIPTFFMAGDADPTAPRDTVEEAFKKSKASGNMFASLAESDHYEPILKGEGYGRWNTQVAAWFDCHLKGDEGMCEKAYVMTCD